MSPRRETPWRLLQDGTGHGAWNMGVDEAMLVRAATEGVATFRLYTWDGPWLSLGQPQIVSDALAQPCRAAGVGLVRRATGGRAVLHGADLTYAVAAPEEALPGGLRATYDVISRGLVAGLRRLGVAVERSPQNAPAPGRGVFDCFQAPAGHELCVAGRKLAGSAQRRWRGALLQHGSIRVRADAPAAARAAGLAGSAATDLAAEGHGCSESVLRDALVDAMAEALGAVWKPGSLEEPEARRAASRVQAHRENSLATPGLPHADGSRHGPSTADRYS